MSRLRPLPCVDIESLDIEFMFDEFDRLFIRDPFPIFELVILDESAVFICEDELFVVLLLVPVVWACALKLAAATTSATIITTFFIRS